MNTFCEELYAKYYAALDDIRYLQGRIVELEEILREIQEEDSVSEPSTFRESPSALTGSHF